MVRPYIVQRKPADPCPAAGSWMAQRRKSTVQIVLARDALLARGAPCRQCEFFRDRLRACTLGIPARACRRSAGVVLLPAQCSYVAVVSAAQTECSVVAAQQTVRRTEIPVISYGWCGFGCRWRGGPEQRLSHPFVRPAILFLPLPYLSVFHK